MKRAGGGGGRHDGGGLGMLLRRGCLDTRERARTAVSMHVWPSLVQKQEKLLGLGLNLSGLPRTGYSESSTGFLKPGNLNSNHGISGK